MSKGMSLGVSVPLAIVIGCVAIGLGLFFGQRRPAPPRETIPTVPVPAEGPDAMVRASVVAEVDRMVAERAGQALDAERAQFVRACWPAAHGTERATFDLRLIFSNKGELLSYAVNDPPNAKLLPVAKCLRRQKPLVTVPAPGRLVSVRLAFDMP